MTIDLAAIRTALDAALEGAQHGSCAHESPNPGWHCCDWRETADALAAALPALDRLEAIEQAAMDLKAAYDGLDANPLPTPEHVRLMAGTQTIEQVIERREAWARKRHQALVRLFALLEDTDGQS